MKKLFIGIFFSVNIQANGNTNYKSSSVTPNQSSIEYHVIPFTNYELTDSQKIHATFQIKCFQKLINLIRYDVEVSASEVTTIIGALVQELHPSVCSEAHDIIVDAGWHYSGRKQNIVSIGN